MVGLLVASTALAATYGNAARTPRLSFVGAAVRGTHFAARERVTVRFAAAGRHVTRHSRASGAGDFAAQLPFPDPCLGAMVVVARGATGDGARLKLPQRACPPALQGSG
jgi:hypothetical protein